MSEPEESVLSRTGIKGAVNVAYTMIHSTELLIIIFEIKY
jgi:hypothetical protein